MGCWDKKACFFTILFVKLILDVAVVGTAIPQITPIEEFQTSLQVTNVCQPSQAVCLSNARDLLSFSRSSFWADVISIVLGCFTIIFDFVMLFALGCAEEDKFLEDTFLLIMSAISVAGNAIRFWCLVATNGYLWNGMLQYTTQIPIGVVDTLRTAILSGITPIVLSFILGCPSLIVVCVLFIIANKN